MLWLPLSLPVSVVTVQLVLVEAERTNLHNTLTKAIQQKVRPVATARSPFIHSLAQTLAFPFHHTVVL